MTSDSGVIVRMNAAGKTTIEREENANGAAPEVSRRISTAEGGYRVDYVIVNRGINERGIPGVRIASVDGLLVETDAYGRYSLLGVQGGDWESGRNFILKVDPSTLPPDASFWASVRAIGACS